MKISSVLPVVLLAASLGTNVAIRLPKAAGRKLDEKATTMSNGAELSVNMFNPSEGSTFQLEDQTSTVDLSLSGEASIGLGEPDVAYIYIIDTSDSTAVFGGSCGTVLQCIQEFFKALNDDAIANGSAELAAVIHFDDFATVDAGLQDPRNPAIEDAIFKITNPDNYSNCTGALAKAAELVTHPNNTAGTTVVVFAGDGLCNVDESDLNATAKELAGTGAIVHSVAVGDEVQCDDWNHLGEIPQSSGTCSSIRNPHDLPDIINGLIGANLTSLELKVDDNYTVVENGSISFLDDRDSTRTISGDISAAFPLEGAITVTFETLVVGLAEGSHEICVRVTGEDALRRTKQIEDCHQVEVSPRFTPSSTEKAASPATLYSDTDEGDASASSETWKGWQIFIVIAAAFVSFLAYGTKSALRDKKVNGKEGIEYSAVQQPGKDEEGGPNLPPVDSA